MVSDRMGARAVDLLAQIRAVPKPHQIDAKGGNWVYNVDCWGVQKGNAGLAPVGLLQDFGDCVIAHDKPRSLHRRRAGSPIVSRGNSELTHYTMPQPTGRAQEQLLSILQTAQNRLEYLTPNDWALFIDRAKEVTFQKDEILIQKGKQTKMVYVLVKGTARIEGDFKARIAQIGPGQISGEMGFLENNVASATVTAEEEVKAYAIEWSGLGDLFEQFPNMASRFYRSLAVILARRLREQNEILEVFPDT